MKKGCGARFSRVPVFKVKSNKAGDQILGLNSAEEIFFTDFFILSAVFVADKIGTLIFWFDRF